MSSSGAHAIFVARSVVAAVAGLTVRQTEVQMCTGKANCQNGQSCQTVFRLDLHFIPHNLHAYCRLYCSPASNPASCNYLRLSQKCLIKCFVGTHVLFVTFNEVVCLSSSSAQVPPPPPLSCPGAAPPNFTSPLWRIPFRSVLFSCVYTKEENGAQRMPALKTQR